MVRKSPLYSALVDVSRKYLGPAGERFMRRQIETHLSIRPEDIDQQDIDELVVWSRLAFAMLTDNSQHIDSFTDDLTALGENDAGNTNGRRD